MLNIAESEHFVRLGNLGANDGGSAASRSFISGRSGLRRVPAAEGSGSYLRYQEREPHSRAGTGCWRAGHGARAGVEIANFDRNVTASRENKRAR